MTTEADDDLNLEPVATLELITAALEAVQSQGFDVNPYSVAREAGISAETLFINKELMTLVIAARGDQSTFSIDSHLVERCQELDSELAKLLAINQEIYDRALEMEERVMQLEAKIGDMEEDSEKLTMQLQNSWHLGYKKGLSDGQSQEIKASQRPMIDIELPKEEAAPASPPVDIELPKEEKQSIKSMIDIELPKEEKQSIKSMIDIELPKEEKQSIKSMIDIELPKEERQSIKSMIDIELPKEERQSIKSMIDIELPKEEAASQTNFSAEEEEKDTVEVPPVSGDHEPVTAAPSAPVEQSGGAHEPAPPVVSSSDPAPVPSYNDRVFNAVSDSWVPGNLVESYGGLSWREVETIYQYSAAAGPSSPNLVFEPLAPGQAVGARVTEPVESKGHESQAAGAGGALASGTVTARDGDGRGTVNRGETQPLPTRSEVQAAQAGAAAQATPTAGDAKPMSAPTPTGGGATAPPILKAAAPTPRPEAVAGQQDTTQVPGAAGAAAGPPAAKQSARSTFTNLRGRAEAEPPMERTMSQFLGDTDSYINLDRVTLEPLTDEPPAPLMTPPQSADHSAAPASSQFARPSENPAQSQAETQTIPGAAQAPSQAEIQARQAAIQAMPSQAETQTLAGATQALAAAAKWRAEGGTTAPPDFATSATPAATAPQTTTQAPTPSQAEPQASAPVPAPTAPPPPPQPEPTVGPGDARWSKDSDVATYDGLTAVGSEAPADVIDLDKLDIFEGLEDIDELSQIEVIEDVIIPGTTPSEPAPAKKGRYKSSEHVPVVSSDDLHDLIKSRIKKAEEPHEPPRVDAFITPPAPDKAAGAGTGAGTEPGAAGGSAAATGTESGASVPSAKELEALRQGARNKFVGGKASSGSPIAGAPAAGSDSPIGASTPPTPSVGVSARAVPPEIRKACMILGVRPEELTLKEVHEKWKSQITAEGVHPDQGGDNETAIYLNTAKDTLVKWINDQAPKLGKKFGKKDEK